MDYNFEEKLMELELHAQEAGVSRDDMITAYEQRKMCLEEEAADEAAGA